MAGFADLVGRNIPALGVNRSAGVAGDTWKEVVGPFKDASNVVIPMNAGVVFESKIVTLPVGGTVLATASCTGGSDGTITVIYSSTDTAPLAVGDVRNVFWYLTATSGGQTITIWSAVESMFQILSK